MYANGCRCLDPLIFADEPEHCYRCGHGPCVVKFADRAPRHRRLPWDLGALQREGKHPDPCLENVVRLDRLCPPARPKLTLVPPATPASRDAEDLAA